MLKMISENVLLNLGEHLQKCRNPSSMSLLRGENRGCNVASAGGMKQTLPQTPMLILVSNVSNALLSLGASEGLIFQHEPGYSFSSSSLPRSHAQRDCAGGLYKVLCSKTTAWFGVQNVFYLNVLNHAHTLHVYFCKLAIASFVTS